MRGSPARPPASKATRSPREQRAQPQPSDPAASPWLGRRWWLGLAGLVLFGLLSQALILSQAWRNSPLAHTPLVDAEEYWAWAGRIADGHWLGNSPFTSAPLYPYLLGIVRAAGGGLPAVYALQAGLHLLTVVLLSHAAAKRFGAVGGLLAGALYVAATEPAYYTGRVLNCTLQLTLVAGLWHLLLRAQARQSLSAWALVGVLGGLNTLANPPVAMMLGFLAVWTWWQSSGRRRGLLNAAVMAGAAAVVISPAPLHNYLASKEFIPLTGHAGLSFAVGNAPGATGTYTRIPGVSLTRQEQNRDAFRLYERTTGQPATWNAVNRFFFQRGLDYWRSNPGAALVLFGRKFYWFLTAHYAGDTYWPDLEIEQGNVGWLRSVPLPTAWLTIPGLLAIAVLAGSPRRYGAELILVGVPLLTVLLFLYTPRYRLPAVPLLAATCAWALHQAAQWRQSPRWSAGVLAAVALGPILGAVNQAAGFDLPQRAVYQDRLGSALFRQRQFETARERFQSAVQLMPKHALLQSNLASALLRCGDTQAALRHFQRAVELDPTLLDAHKQVSQILCARGDCADGIAALRRAHELAPDDVDVTNNLAWYLATTPDLTAADRASALRLAEQATAATRRADSGVLDTLAAALAANGDFSKAAATLEEALALEQRHGQSAQVPELRQRLELYRAGQPYVAPVPASQPPR